MSQEWHYAHGGVQKGPVTEPQLKALIALGQLLPNELVWRDGLAEWVKAGTVRELFSAKSALPPPPPPPTPKQPPLPASTQVTPTKGPIQQTQTTRSADPTTTGSASVGSSPVKEWYYAQSGTQIGPIEFGMLSQLVTAGQIQPTDLVWRHGMEQWRPACSFTKLCWPQPSEEEEGDVPPPPPPSVPSIQVPSVNNATIDSVRQYLVSLKTLRFSFPTSLFKPALSFENGTGQPILWFAKDAGMITRDMTLWADSTRRTPLFRVVKQKGTFFGGMFWTYLAKTLVPYRSSFSLGGTFTRPMGV